MIFENEVFKNICNSFSKIIDQSQKKGKNSQKAYRESKRNQGSVWCEANEKSLTCYAAYSPCQAMVRYCSAISIRHLRGYIYTSFAWLYLYGICVAISIRHLRGYIYVIYVAVSIRYISVVSNTGCAFSHYDL